MTDPAPPPARFVELDVALDEVDPASGLAWQAGATGIEERSAGADRVRLVVGVGPAGPDPLVAALGAHWSVEVTEVPGAVWDGWLDAWRAHARSWRVGRIVVRPPWLAEAEAEAEAEAGAGTAPDVLVLDVDPGRAFGSGAHASTRLALGLLVEWLDADQARGAPAGTVVDVGCGSGVLAVAAAAIGVPRVVAVDIDPAAVAATVANAERNGVAARVSTSATPVADLAAIDASAGPVVVVANVLLPVQRDLAADLVRLAGGGPLVLAGILVDQRADLLACFPGHEVVAERHDEGWCGVVLGPA